MSKKIDNIVIVGGGSSGWIVASSLITQLNNKKITVIESPNIPTIGVGESTVGGVRGWMRMVGIRDKDFFPETDASYKLAIKFTNFYKINGESWYYPFGKPCFNGTFHRRDDWFIKKALYPETPTNDFAESYYPAMALLNANTLMTNHRDLDNFDFYSDTAFHFDATKFGSWLRDKHAKPKGVDHIVDEVETVVTDDEGIKELILKSGRKISADLYVDCTGFNSILLGKALNVPFISYENFLPNNRAWAVQLPYTNKENQLVSYTDCTAVSNGWIWKIPLWSRLGSGYVYSDKYIEPEDAKKEFINHLESQNLNVNNCEFKDIKMRTGTHEKLWVKNVVAIGLSAAFVEPLESTGLLTTHDFSKYLCNVLIRDRITQWDRDEFNLKCNDDFNYWAQFVAMHYALSHRDDTEYWRDIGKRSYVDLVPTLNKLQTQCLFHQTIYQKNFVKSFQEDDGINCLAAGMNWNTNDIANLRDLFAIGLDLKEEFSLVINNLSQRQLKWKEAAKTAPSLYQYLKNNIYKD